MEDGEGVVEESVDGEGEGEGEVYKLRDSSIPDCEHCTLFHREQQLTCVYQSSILDLILSASNCRYRETILHILSSASRSLGLNSPTSLWRCDEDDEYISSQTGGVMEEVSLALLALVEVGADASATRSL